MILIALCLILDDAPHPVDTGVPRDPARRSFRSCEVRVRIVKRLISISCDHCAEGKPGHEPAFQISEGKGRNAV